jgi:hypothetical protein
MPLSEVPDVLRALGYYPSDYEISNLQTEVKFADFASTKRVSDSVDLAALLRLYINHRPALGVQAREVQGAFAALAGRIGVAGTDGTLNTAELLQLLQNAGESMTEDELACALGELLGGASSNAALDIAAGGLPGQLTPEVFVGHVLGLGDAARPESSSMA